jgi:hypothetical protein
MKSTLDGPSFRTSRLVFRRIDGKKDLEVMRTIAGSSAETMMNGNAWFQ